MSCHDDDGTIYTGTVNTPPNYTDDPIGNGDECCLKVDESDPECSEPCFLDLTDPIRKDFYKFTRENIVQDDYGTSNILTLDSFGDEYLLGVPTTTINSENNNIVYVVTEFDFNENNIINVDEEGGCSLVLPEPEEECEVITSENCSNSNVNGTWSDLSELCYKFGTYNNFEFSSNSVIPSDVQDSLDAAIENGFDAGIGITDMIRISNVSDTLESEISISSGEFDIIEKMKWDPSGGYDLVNDKSTSESKKYFYSQAYKTNNFITIVDMYQNSIYGDVLLVDYIQDVIRDSTIWKYSQLPIYDSWNNQVCDEGDSLVTENGNQILSRRVHNFHIKHPYKPDDSIVHRRSTDCNDNYQIDDHGEVTIFATPMSSAQQYSFQEFCLDEACSDGISLSSRDCCDNNGGLWNDSENSCIESACIDEDSTTDQQCCENNGGEWEVATNNCSAELLLTPAANEEQCCNEGGGDWNAITSSCENTYSTWQEDNSSCFLSAFLFGDICILPYQSDEDCCSQGSGVWFDGDAVCSGCSIQWGCEDSSYKNEVDCIAADCNGNSCEWEILDDEEKCCEYTGGTWDDTSQLCTGECFITESPNGFTEDDSSEECCESNGGYWEAILNDNLEVIDRECVSYCSDYNFDSNKELCCIENGGIWNSITEECGGSCFLSSYCSDGDYLDEESCTDNLAIWYNLDSINGICENNHAYVTQQTCEAEDCNGEPCEWVELTTQDQCCENTGGLWWNGSSCSDDTYNDQDSCESDLDCNNDGEVDDPCEWNEEEILCVGFCEGDIEEGLSQTAQLCCENNGGFWDGSSCLIDCFYDGCSLDEYTCCTQNGGEMDAECSDPAYNSMDECITDLDCNNDGVEDDACEWILLGDCLNASQGVINDNLWTESTTTWTLPYTTWEVATADWSEPTTEWLGTEEYWDVLTWTESTGTWDDRYELDMSEYDECTTECRIKSVLYEDDTYQGLELEFQEQECCEHHGGSWVEADAACNGASSYWVQCENPSYLTEEECINADCNNFEDDIQPCEWSPGECYSTKTTMYEFCWDYYDEEYRTTATCYVDDGEYISYYDEDETFNLTYCDRGNNYYDSEEIFVDGFINDIVNNQWDQFEEGEEPFEDRNCNSIRDDSENLFYHKDCYAGLANLLSNGECAKGANGDDWDDWEDCCSEILSGSDLYWNSDECSNVEIDWPTSDGTDFCDVGNKQWDNQELYYEFCDAVNEDTLEPIYDDGVCDGKDLFYLSNLRNTFMVTYENENNAEYIVDDIFPSGNFFDTGTDGCFDELEDSDGSCVCEFIDTDSAIPPCSAAFTDLNNDDVIDVFDVAISNKSAYNYGECSNGYSGSEYECCIHNGCEWFVDTNISSDTYEDEWCLWSDCESQEIIREHCSNDITQSCWIPYFHPQCNNEESEVDCFIGDVACECEVDDVDCAPEGTCIVSQWVQNLDPNNDNNDPFDIADDDSADKTQNNGKWDTIGDENDMENYIYEITEDFINDNDETISYETFFSDPISYSSYKPSVRENAYIITKKLNYTDCNNPESFCGEEKIYALADSLKIVQKIGSAPIKISDNTIYSKKVIDQIDFSNDEDASSYSDMLELLDFYITILNQYNIIKTTFTNTLGESDYDYLLFKESDEEIVKMIHPFYHYVPNNFENFPIPDDNITYDPDNFWSEVHLVPDVILKSTNNKIREGQQWFWSDETSLEGTGDYKTFTEYYVTKEAAVLSNAIEDPNCSNNYTNLFSCEGDIFYDCSINFDCSSLTENECTNQFCYVNQGVCTAICEDSTLESDGSILWDDDVHIGNNYWEEGENFIDINFSHLVDSQEECLQIPGSIWDSENLECGNGSYDGPTLPHCFWEPGGGPDNSDVCESLEINRIEDCFLITRVVTTTQIGTGLKNQIGSETYLKQGFPIVKEDIAIQWESLDWVMPEPEYISKIEYKKPDPNNDVIPNSNNNFFDNNIIEIDDMNNMQDFDFSPFKITPTMGFQRIEMESLNE